MSHIEELHPGCIVRDVMGLQGKVMKINANTNTVYVQLNDYAGVMPMRPEELELLWTAADWERECMDLNHLEPEDQ
jgi:hypothetical protein